MQPPAEQTAVADAFTAAINTAIAAGDAAAVAAVAEQTQAKTIFSGVQLLRRCRM